MMHAVLANKQAHLEKVKDLFSRLGAEETGSITYLMFKEKIDSPEVREYFESLGLVPRLFFFVVLTLVHALRISVFGFASLIVLVFVLAVLCGTVLQRPACQQNGLRFLARR